MANIPFRDATEDGVLQSLPGTSQNHNQFGVYLARGPDNLILLFEPPLTICIASADLTPPGSWSKRFKDFDDLNSLHHSTQRFEVRRRLRDLRTIRGDEQVESFHRANFSKFLADPAGSTGDYGERA